jgi:hypothetical protein
VSRSPIATQATSGDVVREKWWAERGSGLYLNDEEGVEAVIDIWEEEVEAVKGAVERNSFRCVRFLSADRFGDRTIQRNEFRSTTRNSATSKLAPRVSVRRTQPERKPL